MANRRPIGKPTKAERDARQRARDLERYEAAMKAQREHERVYGPIRPGGCVFCVCCGNPYCEGVTEPFACSYSGARP
jgi:hypothetical protein